MNENQWDISSFKSIQDKYVLTC